MAIIAVNWLEKDEIRRFRNYLYSTLSERPNLAGVALSTNLPSTRHGLLANIHMASVVSRLRMNFTVIASFSESAIMDKEHEALRRKVAGTMNVQLQNLPNSLELIETDQGMLFRYIDERKLPDGLVIQATSDWRAVIDAIQQLAVRGAPALGIAGAAALALWADNAESLADLDDIAETIASARPTAVNLRWGVERALNAIRSQSECNTEQAAKVLFELVQEMQEEDERVNRAIGAHGASLLKQGSRVLTHCNAGSLATFFYGTALGIVYTAATQGKIKRVYADETRPVCQGSRLTVWELARVGIPTTLICDNMAASLMARGEVDAVIVGADRIARNGDAANKIGTYGLAVLAHEHGIPFYVAAPTSTIDVTLADGSEIVIEQRNPQEVLPKPIEGVEVWNPAFDVTPARYITKIVTENGLFEPAELVS